MVRTKQTPRGNNKSHHPKGMATVTFSGGTEADPKQQQQEDSGKDTEDSQNWPKYGEEEGTTQGLQVQVSPKVRQVTNPSRLKERQRPLLRKPNQHQDPGPKTRFQQGPH